MSRRDNDEPGRYPSGNPYGPRHEDSDNSEVPVDLAAVQADDALLDMLGSGDTESGDTDAELARVLVAWRREVDSEPIGELVDTEEAVAVINAARRPQPHRRQVLGPLAAAAAVLVIAFSGVGLAAKSAQPGERLFGLTKVLYADYARSAEAAKQVETELAEAQTALRQGETARAQESLQQAEQQLTVIAEPEGRTRLAVEHDQLERKLEQMSGPDKPGTPGAGEPPAPATPSPSEPVLPPPPSESATTTSSSEQTTSVSPTPTESTTSSTPTVVGGPTQETLSAETRADDPTGSQGPTSPVTPPSG